MNDIWQCFENLVFEAKLTTFEFLNFCMHPVALLDLEGKKPRNCKSTDVDVRDYTKAVAHGLWLTSTAEQICNYLYSLHLSNLAWLLELSQHMTVRLCWKTTTLTCSLKAQASSHFENMPICASTVWIMMYSIIHFNPQQGVSEMHITRCCTSPHFAPSLLHMVVDGQAMRMKLMRPFFTITAARLSVQSREDCTLQVVMTKCDELCICLAACKWLPPKFFYVQVLQKAQSITFSLTTHARCWRKVAHSILVLATDCCRYGDGSGRIQSGGDGFKRGTGYKIHRLSRQMFCEIPASAVYELHCQSLDCVGLQFPFPQYQKCKC